VKPVHVLLDLLLIVFLVVAVGLFGVFWFPLLLLVVVVVLSLWLVRRYYLDYLDDPEAGRTGP
jgi:membrane protein implicated in regulation of membrane protease activity